MFWSYLTIFFIVSFGIGWLFRHPKIKENQNARNGAMLVYLAAIAILVSVLLLDNFITDWPSYQKQLLISTPLVGAAMGDIFSKVTRKLGAK